MGGYTKNIAVIKGLKEGFSADGGKLSGLVRAEKYGASLKIEITLINFAPLSEGRYVAALSDGNASVIIENCLFEGVSDVDTSVGFAAEIFYVNGGVFPIASAVCGGFYSAALGLRALVEESENLTQKKDVPAVSYEDEAIAEENFYEYAETDKDGGAVCEDKEKEADGRAVVQNEAAVGSVEEEQSGVDCGAAGINDAPNMLARGKFYEKMSAEIEGLLSAYPVEEPLCRIIENSRWVRISYGDGKYYVFGVIYLGETPKYICYGVPAEGKEPPDSMEGLAGFIPSECESGGYWVMYQDAETGASLHISFE